MMGAGKGVVVAGTAVLITGWARVGLGGTAVSSVDSLLWQAVKSSRDKVHKMMSLRIDDSITKPFAKRHAGGRRRVKGSIKSRVSITQDPHRLATLLINP